MAVLGLIYWVEWGTFDECRTSSTVIGGVGVANSGDKPCVGGLCLGNGAGKESNQEADEIVVMERCWLIRNDLRTSLTNHFSLSKGI